MAFTFVGLHRVYGDDPSLRPGSAPKRLTGEFNGNPLEMCTQDQKRHAVIWHSETTFISSVLSYNGKVWMRWFRRSVSFFPSASRFHSFPWFVFAHLARLAPWVSLHNVCFHGECVLLDSLERRRTRCICGCEIYSLNRTWRRASF